MPNAPDEELPTASQGIGWPDGSPHGVVLPSTLQVPIGPTGMAQSLMAPLNAISWGVQERVSSEGADTAGVAEEPPRCG
jgi:hypothetical protein